MEEMIKKATKKPVTITFVEWTGDNLREVIEFTGQSVKLTSMLAHDRWEDYERLVHEKGLKIYTLEGSHMATIGDMIIKGVQGECYPCKPDIFKLTYDILK